MKRYRLELILGAVFLAVLLAYCHFVGGGPKMTKEEVGGYVAKIEQGLQMPEPMRSEFIARVRAWGEADDGGPVYLANIFHANDAEEMQKAMWAGLDIKPAADGEKTHEIYLEAVKPLILPKGVWPAIGTRAQGVGVLGKTNISGFHPGFDEWTEININRYPGRRTILQLFSHPTYLKVMPYKLVGLRLLTVPTTLRFQLPDLRLALGSTLLIIFLAVGWIRAARRTA
jgi:hypothetical protein